MIIIIISIQLCTYNIPTKELCIADSWSFDSSSVGRGQEKCKIGHTLGVGRVRKNTIKPCLICMCRD